MIKRFVFGTPFPTESVVLDLPVETGPVPFLTPDGAGWRRLDIHHAGKGHRLRSGRDAPRPQQTRLALRDQQYRRERA